MAQGIQTSFIPKRAEERRARPPISVGGILSAVAVIILLVSIVSASAVFFFKRFVSASIERKEAQLVAAKEAFEDGVIEELVRLDRRIVESGTLLENHIIPTKILSELESVTLQSVQFDGFNFSVDEEGAPQLILQGVAESFNAVAVQVEEFEKTPMFVVPVFSNLSVTTEGDVTFTVDTTIDTTSIAFDIADAPMPPAFLLPEDTTAVPDTTEGSNEGTLPTFGTGTIPTDL